MSKQLKRLSDRRPGREKEVERMIAEVEGPKPAMVEIAKPGESYPNLLPVC